MFINKTIRQLKRNRNQRESIQICVRLGIIKKSSFSSVFHSDLIEFKIVLFRSYLIKEKTKKTNFLKNLSFSGSSE